MKKSIITFALLAFIFIVTTESCNPDTPTTPDVTYTTDVAPIISTNCLGCHSGTTPSGDLLLTTYAEVRASAETDTLTLRMNDAAMPMPPTGLISEADRNTVQDWVDGGYKE